MLLAIDAVRATYDSAGGTSPGLAIEHDSSLGRVLVRVAERTVFSIALGPTPDDGWTITSDPPAPRCPTPCERLLAAYRAWTADGDRHVPSVLSGLPAGRYALLRTTAPSQNATTMLFGNDVRATPTGVDVLWNETPIFAAWWRSRPNAPARAQVACALACLAYTGVDAMTGLLFFEPFAHATHGQPIAMREHMLIVPLSGPMLIDALCEVPREDACARWSSYGAAYALDLLASAAPQFT